MYGCMYVCTYSADLHSLMSRVGDVEMLLAGELVVAALCESDDLLNFRATDLQLAEKGRKLRIG